MAIQLKDYDPAANPGYGGTLDDSRFSDGGDLIDTNGNELLSLDSNASAVNQVQVANAVTGSAPEVKAIGSDTNVALQLSVTGTARVLVGDVTASAITSGAVNTITQNTHRGVITIPLQGIVAGSAAIVDITNNKITPSSVILHCFGANTNTAGTAIVMRFTAGAGSATLVVGATGVAAINGNTVVNYVVL